MFHFFQIGCKSLIIIKITLIVSSTKKISNQSKKSEIFDKLKSSMIIKILVLVLEVKHAINFKATLIMYCKYINMLLEILQ